MPVSWPSFQWICMPQRRRARRSTRSERRRDRGSARRRGPARAGRGSRRTGSCGAAPRARSGSVVPSGQCRVRPAARSSSTATARGFGSRECRTAPPECATSRAARVEWRRCRPSPTPRSRPRSPRSPGWARAGDEIVKTFDCGSFADAIAFVVRIGFLAERADHHPDIDVRWRQRAGRAHDARLRRADRPNDLDLARRDRRDRRLTCRS